MPVAAGAALPPSPDAGEVVQGGDARWRVGSVATPSGLSGSAPGLSRDLSVALDGPHSLVPGSLTTATGWTTTAAPGGFELHAGDDALLGESVNEPFPEPAKPISQGSGGDGHVPILVGSKVFAFFHHSAPTSVTCLDRSTGYLCPGYPKLLNMATDNIPGPAAVVDSRIYVHLRTIGGGDPYALYCWDAASDQPCGLVVLERGHNGDGSAPVLVDDEIWALGASGTLHCVDPATNEPCTGGGVDTALANGGSTLDIVAHGDRVYVSSETLSKVACVDVAIGASCSGWAAPRDLESGSNIVNRYSAAGVADGVCAVSSAGLRVRR